MRTAFFHDERFTRDASGTYHGTGAIPYAALARYLGPFDGVVVVGRLDAPNAWTRTVVSGPGLEFACIPRASLGPARGAAVIARHARAVLARVDAAVIRLPSMIGPIACREARRAGIPYLVEVVADAFDALWHHGSWKGRLGALPLALWNRRAIHQAPFSIYVTREALQRRYPPGGLTISVSDVIAERASPELLQARVTRLSARAPRDPAVLGLVGSYDVGYKGHATALAAVALLRREGRAVTLRCIGAGDPARWRARAEALGVADAVDLGRALPHGAAVFGWMDALDLFVVPSLVEGLPRALVEAMSRGIPAIGSRRGGIPELLPADALHRAGDARGMAAAIAHLLDHPAELASQAVRSWTVAGEYDRDLLERRRAEFVRSFRAAVRPRTLTALQPLATYP
jgi:glycosyltransferase involved in cell wall biosynthesis